MSGIIKPPLWATLPLRLSNRTVVGALEALRRLRMGRRVLLPPPSRPEERHYIEDQNHYDHMPYGRSTVSAAGCEAIAAYNALLALEGSAPPLEALTRVFLADGALRRGRWGTSPRALADFFRRRGHPVALATSREDMEAVERRFRVLLLVYFNDRRDVRGGIHTICITRRGDGLWPHNVTGSGAVMPVYPSLSEMRRRLWRDGIRPLALIGVDPRPEPTART